MMYCTGGIRCEYFSARLKQKGFNNVYKLQVDSALGSEGDLVMPLDAEVPPKDLGGSLAGGRALAPALEKEEDDYTTTFVANEVPAAQHCEAQKKA